MFKLFRMMWHKITGQTDRIIDEMSKDPDVASARYAAAKAKKTKNTKILREAVAALVVQSSKKKNRIVTARQSIAQLQTESNGYLILAQRVSSGMTKEQAESNVEYQSHRAAYASKMATITDKKKEIEGEDGNGGLVGEQCTLDREIVTYKSQLLEQARKIGRIDEEKEATIAAITAAREREGLADIVSGISDDSGDKELEEMRSVRERAIARSEIAIHMAGTSVTNADALAREVGAQAAGSSDFDALMNFNKDLSKAASNPIKLPEN